MTYKKYLSLLIVISIMLAMLPSMSFALDETQDNTKQTDKTEQTEQEKALPKLGETPAPTPEEGYTLIGKVGDVYYEAKLNDDVAGDDGIAVVLGEKLVINAPTITDFTIKKYVSDSWVELEEGDTLPEISYLWNDSSTNSTYTINAVALEDYNKKFTVKLSLNAIEIGSKNYEIGNGKIFNSSFQMKDDQSVNHIEVGDYVVIVNSVSYDILIPQTLSRTAKAIDVVSNCVSVSQIADEGDGLYYKEVNRSVYEDLISSNWYKDGSLGSSDSKYKIKNDGSSISFEAYLNGSIICRTDFNIIDGIDSTGIIKYPPVVEPGPSTKVVLTCALDSELEFDSVKYEWSKSHGWNEKTGSYDLFGDVTVGNKFLINGVYADTWMRYVCTVTATVNGKKYVVQEEVVLDLGSFVDKGILAPGQLVTGQATGQDRSYDVYTFTPAQTGKYAIDIDINNFYICDNEGNKVDLYDAAERTVILKARNIYRVYVKNFDTYNMTVRNLITCDHSCGTKLINASETYSGDKVCQNCELLIEKGHVIVKPDPQPDPKKEDKKGTSSNTGDSNDMFPFATLLLIAIVGTYLVGSRNNSRLK